MNCAIGVCSSPAHCQEIGRCFSAHGLRDGVHLMQQAGELVRAAKRLGLVLTIEQQPLRPFAMGHHTTVVHVRPARKPA